MLAQRLAKQSLGLDFSSQTLSNNIGDQLILHLPNAILQSQFPAFKARNLQLIQNRLFLQCHDCGVHIPVFNAQQFKLLSDAIIIHGAHIAQHRTACQMLRTIDRS
jgi:hypothetical protein